MTSWQSNLRVGRSLGSLSEVDLSPSEFFLSELQVRYGPRALLYRFLYQAQEAVLQRGVVLEFGSFERLVETNQRNSATWRSMVPLLDPRRGPLGSSCFCILGTNGRGEVVATQAARLFDFGKNNLKAEGESGRLLYPTSQLPKGLGVPKSDDLELAFTGAAADRISGRAVYSGAVWYHPDYRGQMLSAIMPRSLEHWLTGAGTRTTHFRLQRQPLRPRVCSRAMGIVTLRMVSYSGAMARSTSRVGWSGCREKRCYPTWGGSCPILARRSMSFLSVDVLSTHRERSCELNGRISR